MSSPRRTIRTILALASAVAGLGIIVAPAHAAASTVCVGFAQPAADCTSTYAAGSLQAALTFVKNNGSADTVRIASGVYVGDFTMTSPDGDEIAGAGAGSTILRQTSTTGSNTLTLSGDQVKHIRVHDLSIERSGATSTNGALSASRATLDHVIITNPHAAGIGGSAMTAEDVLITNSTISVGGDNARGVYASNGNVTIEDSQLRPIGSDAPDALTVSGLGITATVRRSVIGDPAGGTGFATGLRTDGGTLVLEDSLIDMGTRANAFAVNAANYNSGTMPLYITVRRSTIIGRGTSQQGLVGYTDNPGEQLTMLIEDSVVDMTTAGKDVVCSRGAAGTITSYTVRRTAFEGAIDTPIQSCTITQANNVNTAGLTAAQLFVEPAAANYRPLPGSVLIDAGNPAFVATAGDLLGNARVSDGNADGSRVVDLGAYEYQAPPVPVTPTDTTTGGGVTPPPAADTTRPALTLAGTVKAIPFYRTGKTAFSFVAMTQARALRLTVSEASTARVTLARKVGTKFAALRGSQAIKLTKGARRLTWTGKWQGRAVAAGTYRVTIVATDAAGNASAARSVIVRLVQP